VQPFVEHITCTVSSIVVDTCYRAVAVVVHHTPGTAAAERSCQLLAAKLLHAMLGKLYSISLQCTGAAVQLCTARQGFCCGCAANGAIAASAMLQCSSLH
jgi:hypothetical protein